MYAQQAYLYEEKTHCVEHRIVSIHQPHVRPIVRGKTNANVEVGAKIQVSLMDCYAFLEEFFREVFKQGPQLMSTIEQYKTRLDYYPKKLHLINSTAIGKSKDFERIRLRAKPPERPSIVKTEHVSPGD